MQRTWLGTLAVLALVVSCAHALVLGIDLGSQWYKLAMVRPGSGFDIVLNEQSARKTHTMVGWNKMERAFGSDAFNLQARYPANSYAYLTPLLGKSLDHPIFEEAKDWITFNVVEDPERGSFSIQHDQVTNFKPEELVAMILRHAKELATTAMNTPVKDCVITVPPYLTQHERQAILDAADIAGLKVLSLINDITAFALNYAKDRNFDNDTQNVIFFDVGATSTSALLATFQSVVDIKSKSNKTVSQVLVRSVAWDQTLGGRFLDRNLANHFKRTIKAKYPNFNVDDVKFTLRMLREAQKIKEILSANQQAIAQLVGLGDNDDIALTITRKEFEELNKDIAARVVAPLQRVLEEAGLNKEDIHFVELVGGTSRVPFVQAALKEFLGREELDRHVNGDEGAALGAAFFAAGLSSTFKVKEVRLRDITPYPVDVKINLDQAGESDNEIIIEEGDEAEGKTNTALLHRGNKLNTRKALTFYSYSNFSLDLSYSNPDLLPLGSKNEISHITVSGMPSSSRYNITAKPKVHASFKLTSNGTVVLDHTEVELTVLEAPKPKATPKPKVTEKTEEVKLETEAKPEAEEPKQEGEQPNQEGEHPNQEGEQANAEGEQAQEGEQTQTGEEGATEQTEKTEEGEEAATTEPEATEEAKTEEPELVKRTFKLPLKIASVETLGVKSLDKKERVQAEMRLSQYDYADKQRKELEREKNNLESYIYETRDKLYNDDIVEASTEEERESLSAALSAASDWLEENSDSATTAEYKEQSKILKDKADKIYFRIKEQKAFPRAVAELQRTLDLNRDLLSNITELLNVTEEERDNALQKLETVAAWLKTKQLEQFAMAKNVDPAVTSEEVSRKQSEIEFTTKMLLRKPKKKKPVVEKVKTDEETAEGEEPTTEETEKTENTETPEQTTQEETQQEAPKAEPTEKKAKETPKKEKTTEKKKTTTDKKTTKDKNTGTKKDKKETTKDEL